ncbi:translation initiation factor IF-2 subunit gamma [Candidatus Nanohalococcus occultus]|uniref:translation initiation factor IF-2 subunit gamma n=1 Tax=Candidatus Nanohalococcus occultus TaxID=2978047 RepID=UPI0039E07B10
MTEGIPEANIGLVGHVDHGKTTLTQALSGKWTDEHSQELEKGITIRIGYADVTYYKDDNGTLNVSEDGEEVRTVSLVDAPGHETLMANVLSGAAIMDGAVLMVAADEDCPRPQTREHLAALDITGIENIVIAQNKIDLVDKEQVKENHEQIKEFVEGTVAEDAPIVPISAQHDINIDALLDAIDEEIPTPERDLEADPKMLLARSFDINKPGSNPTDLMGGVVGGSLIEGELEEGEEIEIRPGVKKSNRKWEPVTTEVESIMHGGKPVEKGTPGGLLAVETKLDPSTTKSDGLSGNVLGKKGELPETTSDIEMEVELMERVVGSEGEKEIENIKKNEPLMINAGTGKSAGIVTQAGKHVKVDLKVPICAEEGDRMAISRQIGSRWRLIGHATLTSKN